MGEDVVQHFKTYWMFYLAITILVVLAIILLASFAYARKRDEKYRLSLDEQSNSIRVFVIDLKKDMVKFFNVTTLHKVTEITIGQFYQHFPVSQQQRVINWINAISDPGTGAPDYLETDIQDNHSKKRYFSMLQVEHVDHEKGIIHILSYLMKDMVTSRSGQGRYGLSTVKELESAIAANGKKKGFSACYRFVYKKMSDKDKDIEPLIFNQMKNAIFPFVTGRRYLLQCSGNDLLLSDLRLTEKAKILFLVRSGLNSINRYLALNGLTSILEVRVGIVEHVLFQGSSDSIIEAAKNTALLAYEDNDVVLFYETGRRAKSNALDSSYRTEVERIIEEKKIHYYFRPIYSVDKGRITGYFTKAVPFDAYFDSIEELKDYAIRTEDDKSLFSTIAKDTIHLFLSGNPGENTKLFFPVRVQERSHLLTTFGRLTRAKAANMVFLFSESDVQDALASYDVDAVIEYMKLIRVKGYEVGLHINSDSLKLAPRLYAAFDYFAVGFAAKGRSSTDMDALVRSQLHSLAERLLKYNKPIIATDVEGWAAIELIVSSGLRYVSSETFAPYDLMMNPPSPKSLKRIKEID